MPLLSLLALLLLLVAYAVVDTATTTDAQAPSAFETHVAPFFSSYIPPTILQVEDLPATGCRTSLLAKDHLAVLLEALPPDKRAVLAKLLSASSDIWEAQLYSGELGTGLCLPARNALVLLPFNPTELLAQRQGAN